MPHRPPTRADIGRTVEVYTRNEWLPTILKSITHEDESWCKLDGEMALFCIGLVRVPYTCPDPEAELSMAADWMADQGHDEAARVLMANIWQPIETVPIGRIVLLVRVYENGNWKMHSGCVQQGGAFTWNGREIANWDVQPTHWMPMPLPPVLASEPQP